ncbi:FecR family protein [Xinfangfangia sp. D13-10-4-6]|uniref:FecR family protein n=1 Tax=Pseudogemmobacter hezensis TaxID=2737662 RepID=UPI0015547809|nr:FecR family protein [Pseudogemmobacter hezensis]NPD17420.1 FecR family protein [Pseudogemmobacter hezensis]
MTDRRAMRKRNAEAADWVLRQDEGRLSPAEESRLEAWLDADPLNRPAFEAARRLMGEAGRAIAAEPKLRDYDYRPPGAGRVIGGLAALALTGGLFFWFDGPMRLRADQIAGVGERPVVTLEDGSILQLNASSAVAYDFDNGRRVVRLLRGQAYFEVAPDPNRPFVVEAGDARVTALGTAFDVRLGQNGADVTVTEHAVRLEIGGKPGLTREIPEGARATWDREGARVDLGAGDGQAALAWRQGQLVVENAPLSYVVEEMNRHFAGTILLSGGAAAGRRVSGTMTITDTDAALDFLQNALGLDVTRIGPLVYIADR